MLNNSAKHLDMDQRIHETLFEKNRVVKNKSSSRKVEVVEVNSDTVSKLLHTGGLRAATHHDFDPPAARTSFTSSWQCSGPWC